MHVKIDTKETFSVLTPEESKLSANMADKFLQILSPIFSSANPHVVINFSSVETMDEEMAEFLLKTYSECLEAGRSFVLCHLSPTILKLMEEMDIIDMLNITPTESEAWDIVHMEAIERELLNGEND
jgi:anti-anti-sigma factor